MAHEKARAVLTSKLHDIDYQIEAAEQRRAKLEVTMRNGNEDLHRLKETQLDLRLTLQDLGGPLTDDTDFGQL